MTAATATRVHLEVPEPWRQVTVAPDGARAAQRALVEAWAPGSRGASTDEAVRRLVRDSRAAARSGVAFAAVLLDVLPGPEGGRLLLTGSLTLGFRQVGTADAWLAARGLLATLGPGARPVRLRGDADRPAVLRAEGGRAEVLWLVPGSTQLACLAVAGPDGSDGCAGLALEVAASLRLDRPPGAGAAPG